MGNEFDCSFNNLAGLFKFVDDMDEEPNPNNAIKESNPMSANLITQSFDNIYPSPYDNIDRDMVSK